MGAHRNGVRTGCNLVDSMTQAVMRFRQGGLINHPEDYQEEPLPDKQRVYY